MLAFDLQVNGYAGIDFNQDELTLEQLLQVQQLLARDQVGAILATIITDHLEVMIRRIHRFVELRQQSPDLQNCIVGLHLEGPFINPTDGYRGAHPRDAVQMASIDAMQRLIEAGAGLVKMVTLAPEADPGFVVINYLTEQRIAIAAGHTDASREQLRGAIEHGLKLFTHLGNGCPQQLPRHDNIIQRVLSLSDKLWVTMIADGVHIPFYVLKNYLQLLGMERTIIVTDAIAPAGIGPGRYTLGRWDLEIGADLAARSADGSHLVGSAISMPKVRENLALELQLDEAQIDRLVGVNPRRVLGWVI
jgi:N-acetylglucosamine-6-phosphate deacetylase